MPELIYYIYPEGLYSSSTPLNEVLEANYEGYEKVYMVPQYELLTATTPCLIYFNAKFKIDDDGYQYIVYTVGTGQSELYMSVNDNNNYQK